MQIDWHLQIPDYELCFSFARSSGPGGQNVNKVNSKAILRWWPARNASLPPDMRSRFEARYANRIAADGACVISSDQYRDQTRNREACLEKLRSMILAVAHPPKARKKTRPSRSSIEKGKQRKRRQGEKKALRRRVF